MAENEKIIIAQRTAKHFFRTRSIWQYDVGHVLRFDGFNLPFTFQVHFASSKTGEAKPQVGQDNACEVPPEYTQNSGAIYAWVYEVTEDTGLTKHEIEIPIEGRARPTNQEPTPAEQSVIDQTIAASNYALEKAQEAKQAAETAKTDAETAKGQAEDAATRAALSATDANSSRESADQSATNAGVSERNARASAQAAAGSASAAAQSASNASGSASAASGSASTASTKAGEAASSATAAAGSATTAGAKAGEAASSASAAAQKAQEAASSAGSASQSATNADTARQAAETAKTGAETARQEAQTAASNAAGSASSASGYATNAAGSASAAAQSATAASNTVSGAVATINAARDSAVTAVQNKGEEVLDSIPPDYSALTEEVEAIRSEADAHEQYAEETYAKQDGYYQDMAVGTAEQLVSSKFVEDSEPYILRPAGGSADIGNREYLDAVVGGTLAWNQAVRDEASENSTDFSDVVTVTDAVEDAAGVKVKIEPVQDLHGYDHPWPAGGGKNLAPYSVESLLYVGYQSQMWENGYKSNRLTSTSTGFSFSRINNNYGCGLVLGKLEEGQSYTIKATRSDLDWSCNIATFDADAVLSLETGVSRTVVHSNVNIENGYTFIALGGNIKYAINFYGVGQDKLTFEVSNIQLELGSTATSFAPYENICPITGWDGVKITRTGKNLWNGTLANNANVVFDTKPGQTYTASAKLKGTNDCYLYLQASVDGFQTNELVGRILIGQRVATVTFTAEAGKEYTLWSNASYTEADQIQIELGSTATDYEPYAGNTYDITLPTEAGTVYGGELKVNADGSGSLVVDRANVDMGALTWGLDGNQAHRFLAYNSVSAKPTGNYSAPVNSICNIYKSLSQNALFNGTVGFSIQSMNGKSIYVYDDKYTDSAAFKAALQASNAQLVYELAEPITYTLTASEIHTLLGENNVWADTGDLALTYTGTDEHLTLESGKKYLARISGTDSMLLGSGQEITAAKGTDNVFDLTQMFGTAVADYVYGQGASFFRKWFGKQWYPYNAGELLNVEGLQSHDMVGFNLFDEKQDGETISAYRVIDFPAGLLGKCYMELSDNDTSVQLPSSVSMGFVSGKWDGTHALENSEFRWVMSDGSIMPNHSNTSGGASTSDGGTLLDGILIYPRDINTWKNILRRYKICINLAHNNSRNGEYEPYEKHSYPLDSSVILRGIPKVGANGVYWDGDRYLPDGTVERRYGIFTFSGNENWEYIQAPTWARSAFRLSSGQSVSNFANGASIKMIEYSTVPVKTAWNEIALVGDKVVGTITQSAGIVIRDDSITSLSDFRTWINGKSIVYELATPTTETAEPYRELQIVDDWGTEKFATTGLIPVGHTTQYPANLRDKLQHLPDLAASNGIYLVHQTDSEMELMRLPDMPTANGNYRLKLNVASGSPTFSWEVVT